MDLKIQNYIFRYFYLICAIFQDFLVIFGIFYKNQKLDSWISGWNPESGIPEIRTWIYYLADSPHGMTRRTSLRHRGSVSSTETPNAQRQLHAASSDWLCC